MERDRLTVIENKKRFSVVVAHDDDPTYAGATFKKITEAGHRVDLIVVEDGSLGSTTGSMRRSRKRREGELDNALNILGISSLTKVGIPDGRSDEGRFRWQAKKKVTAALRKQQPDAVVTNSSGDYHMSHRAAADLAEWAIFHAGDAPLKLRDTQFPWKEVSPTESPIALYEMEPQGLKVREGTGQRMNQPGMLVVVSEDELQAELAYYNTFTSQLETRVDGKKPYTEQRQDEARLRGRQANAQYAEGLTQVSYSGELTTDKNILKQIFPHEVKQQAA